jgi:hypothetical protein
VRIPDQAEPPRGNGSLGRGHTGLLHDGYRLTSIPTGLTIVNRDAFSIYELFSPNGENSFCGEKE